jgi:putative membrane protein
MHPRLQRAALAATLCAAVALTAGCAMMSRMGIGPRPAPPPVVTGGMSTDDRIFANVATANGLYEVGVARLAVSRAVDPRVRSYGQMLVDHHTLANNELGALLAARGVTPPSGIPADKVAKTSSLSSTTGAAFDRQFVRSVGMDDHMADIALFERESTRGSDPELRAWAAKTLPTLQAHLQQAQALSASLR